MDTVICVDRAVATLVNVFTVKPDEKDEFLALFRECTEDRFSKMSGWISASLLECDDGVHVVAYSQWQDRAAIAVFRQEPSMKPYFERFQAMAEQQAFICDVVYNLHA